MRYYIIRGNEPSVSCNVSELDNTCIFDGSCLDDALSSFEEKSNDPSTRYMYLIVDFETQKQKLFTTNTVQPGDDVLSYLVLAEYYAFGGKIKYYEDTIVLSTYGFEEEFHNNIAAIKRYLYYYNNKKSCVMSIRYKYRVEGSYYNTRESVVTSTKIMYKTKPIHKRKFLIKPILWDPNPSIEERKFTKEQYKLLFGNKDE